MIRIPKQWCLLPLLAISSACVPVLRPTPLTEVRLEHHRLPVALTECEAEPMPPEPTVLVTFLSWIEEVRLAGDDCRRRLACVAALDRGDSCAISDRSRKKAESIEWRE